MACREALLKKRIIDAGGQLAAAGLVTARAGNLSCRLDRSSMLVTATGTHLGSLRAPDIVKVDLRTGLAAPGGKKPSMETPLHRAIYGSLDCSAVLHCHPPLTNAYFAVCDSLDILTFETHLYLKRGIVVVPQQSVTVRRIAPVIRALGTSRMVVLKNHGVVSIADTFADALHPVVALEEAVKVAVVARLFSGRNPRCVDRRIRDCLYPKGRRL